MDIKRIDSYEDERFSKKVLKQHGAFEVDGLLYEVEITSDYEAIVRGDSRYIKEITEEFRFYAEHISKFYDDNGKCIADYPKVKIFDISLEKIQPSQFYVDYDKKHAVESFVTDANDIIIPLTELDGRYVSLDGHTRLSVAVDRGYTSVKGFLADGGSWVQMFVREALLRGIQTPYDMQVLSHSEYDLKWNKFCDELFEQE